MDRVFPSSLHLVLLTLTFILSISIGNQDRGETNDKELGEQVETLQPEVQVRGYGEPCTCDSDCDFSRWLTCSSVINGVCVCLSRTFTYDHVKEACMVKLGEKCFEIAQDYSQYKDLPPSIRCVEGAFCSIAAGGTCACNTYGYFETSSRDRCERKREYGARCGRSFECKSDACVGGFCVCQAGEYYNRVRDQCVGLSGAYCFTDGDCTDNAICNSVEGARCTCLQGYSPNVKGECVRSLSHGDACNSTWPCNNLQLACVSGSCLCQYPEHQTYDQEKGNCLSFVKSAPCLGDHMCILNAKCVLANLLQECQCLPGFVEMVDGSCAAYTSHGQSCLKNDDCDPLASLVCKDATCQCKDALTLYDTHYRVCRGLVGYRNCQSDDNLCVQNAECLRSNPVLKPRCTCKSSYVTTAYRMCIEDVPSD